MLGVSDIFQFDVDPDRGRNLPQCFICRPLKQTLSLGRSLHLKDHGTYPL
jgi:hypothetical protein